MSIIIAHTKVSTLLSPLSENYNEGYESKPMSDSIESSKVQGSSSAPYDYLLASLAASTMMTIQIYAKRKNDDYGDFSIDLNFHADQGGENWITQDVYFEKQLQEETKDKILEICQKAPTTKTLSCEVNIETKVACV